MKNHRWDFQFKEINNKICLHLKINSSPFITLSLKSLNENFHTWLLTLLQIAMWFLNDFKWCSPCKVELNNFLPQQLDIVHVIETLLKLAVVCTYVSTLAQYNCCVNTRRIFFLHKNDSWLSNTNKHPHTINFS